MGPPGPPGYCDQNSCLGYNGGVQLPPSEGDGEEDDPYGSYGSYYQPNYPVPRPVQPDDPIIDEEELRSPGIQRHARSLAGRRRRQPETREADLS